MKFKVNNIAACISLFKFIIIQSAMIALAVISILIIGPILKGIKPVIPNLGEALIFVVFASVIVTIITIPFVLVSSVIIKGNKLYGRSLWGFKKVIPFKAIDEIKPNDISYYHVAVVVKSDEYGEIHIYKATENIDKLIKIIKSKI